MHDLVWKKHARNDLVKIVEYIAQDNPDAADKLADGIEEKTEKLRENPKMCREGIKRGIHVMVVHPNYIVIYRVLAKKKVVEILRVKHASQAFPATS